MRYALLAPLLLALTACDSDVGLGGDVYRTAGTDTPSAATLLVDGGLALGVLTEGTIAPADGTIGYPGVVRFDADGELIGAEVYRADERSFSGVEGVAPLGGGLAVAVREGDRTVVYRTDARGRDRRVLLRVEDDVWLPTNALVAAPGGFVLSVYARTASSPQLYAFDADGDIRWTLRLPGTQDAHAVGVAPDGDLFVVGWAVGAESGGVETVAARLTPDGAVRWRRSVTAAPLEHDAVAVVGDGLALAVREYVGERGQGDVDERDVEIRILRLDGSGAEVWTERVAVAEVEDGGVRATALAGLPDGRLGVGLAFGGQSLDGGTRATVVILTADGGEGQSVLVGRPYETTTWVTHLLPAPDGRLVVVSAVGPERLGGYGGDDFDIVVSSAALDVRYDNL